MTKKQKKKRSEYIEAISHGWIFETDDPKRSKYFYRVQYGADPKISKRLETRWNINTLHCMGLL